MNECNSAKLAEFWAEVEAYFQRRLEMIDRCGEFGKLAIRSLWVALGEIGSINYWQFV